MSTRKKEHIERIGKGRGRRYSRERTVMDRTTNSPKSIVNARTSVSRQVDRRRRRERGTKRIHARCWSRSIPEIIEAGDGHLTDMIAE